MRTPGLRSYRALVKEAESALRSGNYGKALEKAESAVGRMNDRAPAHVIRGLALGDLKQYAKAVEAFEQALLLDGSALDDIEQGAEAAQVATRAGAYELAKRLLSRVLGRASNSPLRSGLYAVQGDILQLLGPEQLSAAVLAYRSALRNGTAGAKTPVLLGLALALHREGKPEQAVELAAQAGSRMAVERALRSLPLPPSERAARMAVLLESLGDLEGAVRAWSTATGGGPWADHARGALARLQAAAREAGGSR